MPELPECCNRGDEAEKYNRDEKTSEGDYKKEVDKANAKGDVNERNADIKTAKINRMNDHLNNNKTLADSIRDKFTGDDGLPMTQDVSKFLSGPLGYDLDPSGKPPQGNNGYNRPRREVDENGEIKINADSLDITSPSIRGKYNDIIDTFGGDGKKDFEKNFVGWLKDTCGVTPKFKYDTELKKRLGKAKFDELQEHIKSMQDSISDMEKNADPFQGKKWNKKSKDKFNKASTECDKLLKDLGDKWDKYRDKQDAMSTDPSKESGKPKKKTRLETIYKIMALLSLIGLGITGFVILEQYCANHTGCLKVQYSGSGSTQNNIYYCNSKDTTDPTTKNVYLPTQCYCSQFGSNPGGDPFPKGVSKPTASPGCGCGETESCGSGDEKWAYFTADNKTEGNNICSPNADGTLPTSGEYMYYSYIVMTPFDGALDVAGKGFQLGEDWIQLIITAAIWIGGIIGVLIILFIIYKFVANKKPAETLKIQEIAPTKFGKGFMGNLSKYNNYAYMGRCNAIPTRPYMPTRYNMASYKF
jgi:hypothetical protein